MRTDITSISCQIAISADDQLVEECVRDLDNILLGLERAGLEDFELDKTSDFSMASNIGARNNMYATLLNGCYEVAIEFVVLRQSSQGENSAANGKRIAHSRQSSSDRQFQSMTLNAGCSELILHLFGKMRKLHDIVRDKVVMQRGKLRLWFLYASILYDDLSVPVVTNRNGALPPDFLLW